MAPARRSARCLLCGSDHATNHIAQVSVAENEPELSFCWCNKRPWTSPGYGDLLLSLDVQT